MDNPRLGVARRAPPPCGRHRVAAVRPPAGQWLKGRPATCPNHLGRTSTRNGDRRRPHPGYGRRTNCGSRRSQCLAPAPWSALPTTTGPVDATPERWAPSEQSSECWARLDEALDVAAQGLWMSVSVCGFSARGFGVSAPVLVERAGEEPRPAAPPALARAPAAVVGLVRH
jgi:hypothetical protein